MSKAIPGAIAPTAPTASVLAPLVVLPEPIAVGTAHTPSRSLKSDVQRAQEAGGPIDQAAYSCACGYLFSADVSTSVTCPHCGTSQAW